MVNARQVNQVPGRKTDTRDAAWLAMLARAGLLRGSFIHQDATVDDEALAVKRHAPRWIRPLRKFGYLPKMA